MGPKAAQNQGQLSWKVGSTEGMGEGYYGDLLLASFVGLLWEETWSLSLARGGVFSGEPVGGTPVSKSNGVLALSRSCRSPCVLGWGGWCSLVPLFLRKSPKDPFSSSTCSEIGT